jgi:competence protein ComEC
LSVNLKLLPLLAIFAVAGLFFWRSGQRPVPDRLTILSVGQGDCAVMQSGGHTILIDVGPFTNGYDAGKKIVVPKLRKMGVRAIDLILLSHPDADHTGGLGAVLRSFPVATIGISAAFSRHEGMLAQLRALNCMSRVVWLKPLQKTRIGTCEVQVACPTWQPSMNDNDGSEFVKLTEGRSTAVFSGDASGETEEAMEGVMDWRAQVAKLGHHGSRTASSASWLKAVGPAWAVVSCGRNNSYGHPAPEVLQRLASSRIRVARTDTEGDITFVATDSGFRRVAN